MLPLRIVPLLVIGLVLAACGGPDPTPARSGDPGLAPSRSAAPKPSGTAAPPSDATPSATPGRSPGELPPLAVEPVADGLAAPIGIATGPPGWLLVQEQDGRVVALETESGRTDVSLDITDRVLGGG